MQVQPSSPSARRADADAATAPLAAKVFSPQQQHQPSAAAADPPPPPVVVPVHEPTKSGENVTPNVVRDSADIAEKKMQVTQQQQQQQQQQHGGNITLRRSSRTKRSSPALSSVDSGGSGGSESDSHTPRTSDAGIGKTDSPAAVHVQGHSGAANAVAWTSAKDFISVGSDGIARVWDASGAKLSARASFQGDTVTAMECDV